MTERAVIRVRQVNSKRICGWVVVCPDHGDSKYAYRSKKTAVAVAAGHVDIEHRGKAVVLHDC